MFQLTFITTIPMATVKQAATTLIVLMGPGGAAFHLIRLIPGDRVPISMCISAWQISWSRALFRLSSRVISMVAQGLRLRMHRSMHSFLTVPGLHGYRYGGSASVSVSWRELHTQS
ncbi:uncharacterized protein C8Q71DRAFT_324005 [Rhodofomes roseus]|uniref:Uncharacterized protein n=1 Tax=Rhodofomes roseus TaxID=34475 RepID=A0ABQ8K2B6_9APHY|nr:uncharacterized protein C8Q71DRAFT_324005 [Rhodofomes roseus]KAH9830838.1 hypothetical protein C8Q71DRAFT_324005 [Rhodofomes roseus]